MIYPAVMKISKLYLILACISQSVFAQISITKDDMPATDSLYPYIRCVPINVNFSSTGVNHTWDYTNLNTLGDQTLNMVNPSVTPLVYQLVFNNPFFPNNNSTHAQEGVELNLPASFGFTVTDVYNFFKNSNTSFTQVGFCATINGIQTPIPYQVKDKVYQFPLDFGDQDISDFYFEITIPTVGFWKQKGKRTNEVDGWGTIMLPGNQTYEVLRVKTTLNLTDSIRLESAGFTLPISRKQYEYKFLAKGNKFPVLQINTQPALLTTGPQIIQSVIYKKPDPEINTTSLQGWNTSVNVFPNPAMHEIGINGLDWQQVRYFTITDLKGTVMQQGIPLTPVWNVSQLPAGIYLLLLTDVHGQVYTTRWVKG
jgi:hypothetical protein